MEKKRTCTHKRARRGRNVVGIVLMIAVILLSLALIGILIFVAVQVAGIPSESKAQGSLQKTWTPPVTDGLMEETFFVNHAREPLSEPKINGDIKEMQQLSRWNKATEMVVNYHMVIMEEETYGATAYIGSRCLGKTQTRQIDVYSTEDEELGKWYLIEVQERECFHASQYSITPGVYFWKADESSPLYTIGGEITGTEKTALLALLNNYLLAAYQRYVEVRMGELGVQAYSTGSGITAMTLKSETGTLMATGSTDQMENLTANYTENEGDTIYNIVVDLKYGETFEVSLVDLERKSPYNRNEKTNEIAFWSGEEPEEATLEDVDRANEVWNQIHIPEEFSARATIKGSIAIMVSRQVQVDNYYIVSCQQQIMDGVPYNKIVIEYTKRGYADSPLQAGTYIFDNEYIWTDLGVIRVADAPKLYEMLKSFGTETYLNANWQTSMCGDLYLEMYETNGNHSIRLVEKGEQISGYPNYAKVIADNQYQMEELQTHICYRVKERWDVSTDLEATISYKPEKVQFSLPTTLES